MSQEVHAIMSTETSAVVLSTAKEIDAMNSGTPSADTVLKATELARQGLAHCTSVEDVGMLTRSLASMVSFVTVLRLSGSHSTGQAADICSARCEQLGTGCSDDEAEMLWSDLQIGLGFFNVGARRTVALPPVLGPVREFWTSLLETACKVFRLTSVR